MRPKPTPPSLPELRETIATLGRLMDQTINVAQAAAWLHISTKTVYRLIENRILEALETGAGTRVTARSVLDEFKRRYRASVRFDLFDEQTTGRSRRTSDTPDRVST
jgi:excisionase family DNA binding protein